MQVLRDVRPGETVRIVSVSGEDAIKRRIMDMGLTKGAEIYVRKTAPLGDPIEITVRGYELTLRKAEAEKITVERGKV
jgi:ferrous iron transport protein A